MRILLFPLAAVLAAAIAYAFNAQAVPAPKLTGIWPVMVDVDEERGTVTLMREDFEAVVRAYNNHLEQIRALRLRQGCP